MAQKVSSNSIQGFNDDWGYDSRTKLPYSGRSVQDFIKNELRGKAGEFFFEPETSKYYVFANKEDREAYFADPENNEQLLLSSFDAQANYIAEINMITPFNNVVMGDSTGNYLEFNFDIKNRSGQSNGEDVQAKFTFNNSGSIKTTTQIFNGGTTARLLIDEYLEGGVNNITIVITGRTTKASTFVSVNFTLLSLRIESTFDFSSAVQSGDYMLFPYTLFGSGLKFVEYYVDGELTTTDTVTDNNPSGVNRQKNISTTGLQNGKHNLQVRAYINNDGTDYYSNTLYYDFVVCPVNEEWNNFYTFTLLGLKLGELSLSGITISMKQYEKFNYDISVYDSRKRIVDLFISDNGTEVQTIQTTPDTIEELSYTPVTTGTHVLTFTAGGSISTITGEVESGDIEISEATDAILLKLTAKGRSNSESHPNVWTYNNISTTFNNFTWTGQNGWIDDALAITPGSSIGINFAPLNGQPVTNGRTIEIDYETKNVSNENENESLVDITDGNGTGLLLTASTAKLQSSSGRNVNTKYRDGDRVHLTFIINKKTGDDAYFMYIVNNGILERAAYYLNSDSFSVDKNIKVQASGCTVCLHSIKVYDRALSVDEAFRNYAVDSDNIVEIANANNILDDVTGLIDVDKVNARIPVMIITGDMEPIFNATTKDAETYVDIEYRNLQDTSKNFTATHVRIRPQGTSSLAYPRKNLRPYTASKYECVMKDYNGDVITNGLYAFKDKAQPVNCWTLKADYAESSGSHNTGVARIWNDLMYRAQVNNEYVLRTNAQKTALQNGYYYDVRTTVDGFPIVVFYRPTYESALICLGQYNFNNDKSTEKVFGFTDIPGFDNRNVQCYEFLDSSKQIALFQDVSDFDTEWDKSFESRYPDTKEPNLEPLKALCTWINSCKNNQQKWNEEKSDHFDLYKLAAYYVYLMRFGAVDQTVKNAMIMTEDGEHWFFINYDNDTIFGIDNASKVFNAWDYNRQSIVPSTGEYYYAGHDSVLWNCFEADAECMQYVRIIDDALYKVGLTYNNLLDMFDKEQCDKWCERIYNDNGNYKYIKASTPESDGYLHMLQGKRKSYRHWWLQHRMDMFDADWASAAYRERQMVVRFIGGGSGTTHSFTVTSAIESYYGYGKNGIVQENGIHLLSGQNHLFDLSADGDIGIGNPLNIYNANNLSGFQLHGDSIRLLNTLDLEKAVGNSGENRLTTLILGDGENENNVISTINYLSNATNLETLDIRGYKNIISIALTNMPNLHVFNADNSGLSEFQPAIGATLANVTLPDTVQTIDMQSVNLTELNYTPTKTLRNVHLRNMSGSWDAKSFVDSWLQQFSDNELEQLSITLNGIDWYGMTVAQALKIGKVGTKQLQGKITLNSLTLAEYEQLVAVFGQNVFTSQSAFIIDAPTGVMLTGPSMLYQGQSGRFTGAAFPASDGGIKYLLYNGTTLISSSTDGEGNVYRNYNGVTLYEATGVITVQSNLSSDTTINVRAQVSGTDSYSSFITLQAKLYTYPSSININGNGSIPQNGTYTYTKSFNTNNFTAIVTNVEWLISTNNNCSISQSDNDSASIVVTNTPATATTVTLTCTVTFNTGTTRTGTKTITLQQTVPSSVSISGPSTIGDNGTFTYTKSFNTNDFTASVINVAWELSYNEVVSIQSQDDNEIVLLTEDGNSSQIIVTLSCIVTFGGGITRKGERNITIVVFDPPYPIDYVDLGLPSGLLWCTHNVGARKPKERGLYFAWGETTGYVDAESRNSALGLTGGFDQEAYDATSGSSISEEVLTIEHDAANAYMGVGWRMPTKEDLEELIENTIIWGVYPTLRPRYIELESKINGNHLILVDSAYRSGNGLPQGADYCISSSSTSLLSNNQTQSYMLSYFNSIPRIVYYPSYYGFNIRPVREPEPKYVDLGLPSGTLWADRNVGATVPEASGLYFSWGNTSGHTIDEGYEFSLNNYRLTEGFDISNTINHAQDAAYINMGEDWEIPNRYHLEELINNTDHEYTRFNGVYGWKFINRNDSSKYIFLPHCGYFSSSTISSARTYYISKNRAASPGEPSCYVMYLNSTAVENVARVSYIGMNIRAIYNHSLGEEYVDLGLPSGLCWCKHNLGAVVPQEAGLYFAWGETVGYADPAARNAALDRSDGFSSNAYIATGGAAITDSVLTREHDAASQIMGGDWRIPTKTEFEELLANTTMSLLTLNYSVKCIKLTSNLNGNSIIFPLVGVAGSGINYDGNNSRSMTSTMKDSSMCYDANLTTTGGTSVAGGVFDYNRHDGVTIRPVCRPTKTVDLGLPSGTLWADRNLCATAPEDYGAYFSWGNIMPHYSTNGSTFDDSYDWGNSNSGPYASTPGASIPFTSQTMNASYSADSGYDAARKLLGGSWRMPTATEFKELYDNTDKEWTTINGVYGRKFMKKSDHSVYVFFPAVGYGYGTSLNSSGSSGRYWSSSLSSAERGYSLYFDSSSVNYQNDLNRCSGGSVRAVFMPTIAVDLGLPSGTLWANKNLGANAPEDKGLYFAWGETEGYRDAADRNAKLTAETGTSYTGGFDSTSYNRTGGASEITGNLSSSNDAAYKMLGGDWRMPQPSDMKELIENTIVTTQYVNGVNCHKFTHKTDSSIYIIIPMNNTITGNSETGTTGTVVLWSTQRNSSFNSDADVCRCMDTRYLSDYMVKSIGIPIRAIQ